ncbi:UDP-N-acetylmuramate dehydrogenase [Streptantibioticus ferralitis]|uniref:UDP-N-acetylenolpyruvoylglucosamine reductase n=1 Tax=Streptantibioticus ferralitis TaxID=236510 RepID=A0ABT5ZBR2_9ACTN|nr:UDP-N-acetylmuramate dehydrogenase [Streptantibioticus ferralitis]MDF2261281.1 UDP-N-acetylmuramate dehydrogenase [Streptantibioticus ferralitis]
MHVNYGVPLAPLTTLGIGGPARSLAELHDPADFTDFVEEMRHCPAPPVCLGEGSNVLVGDRGCALPVVRIATRGVRVLGAADDSRVLVEVQAGHPLWDLVETVIAEGLAGMEMLAGIPGTTGATPVQNVGAYGQEVSDTLRSVEVWDWQLSRRVTLDAAECALGHRTSMFKKSRRWTVLSLLFALRRAELCAPLTYRSVAEVLDVPLGHSVPLAQAAQAVLAVRRRKGMVLNSCENDRRSIGSVFFSPEVGGPLASKLRDLGAPVTRFPDGTTRVSASWLIRQAGFDLNHPLAPGVRISSLHYTLVADEGASAASFRKAVDIVLRQVLDRTGVRLTPEIDFIGD